MEPLDGLGTIFFHRSIVLEYWGRLKLIDFNLKVAIDVNQRVANVPMT